MWEIDYDDVYDDVIADMDKKDLERELLGRVVTKIDTKSESLTLDDGTELCFARVYSNSEWFEAQLKRGNLTDNAVTAITVTNNADNSEYGDKDYTLHILAADHNICDLNITGKLTSGYYCHSIELWIRRGKQ